MKFDLETQDTKINKNKTTGFLKSTKKTVKLSNKEKTQKKNYLPLILVLCLVLNFVIEFLARLSFTGTFEYIVEQPLFFLYNCVLILFTFLIMLCCRKTIFSMVFTSCLWLGVGITNSVLLHFRRTPFIAADFFVIKSALDIMDVYITKFQIVMIILAINFTLALLIFLFFKEKTKRIDYAKISIMLVVTFAISVIPSESIALGKSENKQSNITDEAYEYGFVCCFLNSIFNSGIDNPDEYSKRTIQSIIEKTTPKNEEFPSQKPNIVVIQLESFIDPYLVNGVQYSKDPIPNFRRLKENNISGKLGVSVFGGGTANTEFEILTGMSVKHFGIGEYPYETVLKDNAVESVCHNVKQYGYKTHAMHNHTGTFYDRNIVYKNLGFDTFTPLEYMNDIQYNGLGWEKSGVFTKLATDAMKKTQDRDFLFVVTAQCHGKYPSEFRAKDGDIDATCPPELSKIEGELEYYAKEVYDEDKWLGDMIKSLQEFDEPVMAVIYGDHMPAIDIPNDMIKDNNLYQTEYIIWKNYEDVESDNVDLKTYNLLSYAFDTIGFKNGIMTRLHQYSMKKKNNMEKEQKYLQYDMIYGMKYAYDELLLSYSAVDTKLGIYDIEISDVLINSNTALIMGENFTPLSVVVIDDDEVETKFVNKNTLRVKVNDIKNYKKVVVAQKASNGTILGQTHPFYKNGSYIIIEE